jgi:hypothetical protein
MVSFADKPILELTIEQWEQYLAGACDDGGVRLKLRKRRSTAPGITWSEAVDVALCFGWIDGQMSRLDDDYTLQAFTPRRKNSPWSKLNRAHIERLTLEGRMRPGGLAEVERAKADGRWDAAYRQLDAAPPPTCRPRWTPTRRRQRSSASSPGRSGFGSTSGSGPSRPPPCAPPGSRTSSPRRHAPSSTTAEMAQKNSGLPKP